MNTLIPIDDVIRRTGLTARALRFYEARGLVRPLRTDKGRRLYGPSDLERVHRIVALKKAGFSLSQISALFDRRPVDLATTLSAQKTALIQQAQSVSEALHLIETALSRIDRGEPLDAETLCSLIRSGESVMTIDRAAWKGVMDQHFTPVQQAEWSARMKDAPSFWEAEGLEKWRDLSSRIEAKLPMAFDSAEALGFVREWMALLEPFTRRATPDMWASSRQFYEQMENWQDQWDPGFSKEVWLFIGEAAKTAQAAGLDIGPLPDFMKQAS
jgi:DNA-binding transcriptional MerR regulator